MAQFVYDNIITIVVLLAGAIGSVFAVYYQHKRGNERATANEEAILRIDQENDQMRSVIVEIQKTNALIEQQIRNHENICAEHKGKLEKHLERIYKKLNGDKD